MSQVSIIDITGAHPDIPTTFTTDDGSAIPIANILEILAQTVPAASIPIYTTGSGNTVTINAQISQAIAATDATKIGLAAFDSAQFTVDANGFVSLAGGGGTFVSSIGVDASTPPGTNPVVASGSGQINVTGAQVSAGSVGAAVIRTNSLAANTYTIEIQRSSASATTNSALNGVAHFDSANFSVDANGFVTIAGSGLAETITGNTGGPISPVGGNWDIVTANTTLDFAGTAGTQTLDFGLTNLYMGADSQPGTIAALNIGIGLDTLGSQTQSGGNVAVGHHAMDALTTGSNNIGLGNEVLGRITTSVQNVAIGSFALDDLLLSNGSNTAVGYNALSTLTTGASNISIGVSSGSGYTTSESSNIVIGSDGVTGESNTIRIGVQGAGLGQQLQTHIAGVINTVSGRVVKTTIPGAYPYTTLTTDYFIKVDTSSARTIVPLADPVTGTTYIIKDIVGSAATNNITITPSGKNIDGSASYTIDSDYGVVSIVYNGTEWSVSGSDIEEINSIVGGPGITVSTAGSTFTVNSVVFTDHAVSTAVTSDSGSFCTAAGVTLTLPSSPAQGELLHFVCTTSDTVILQAPAATTIRIGSLVSSSAGTATSTLIGDSLTLRYYEAASEWIATSVIGTWVIA